MSARRQIIVSGGFDDIRSRQLRFLEEAAKLGELNVLLWPDEAIEQIHGQPPKFPLAERLYFLNAVRYVTRVVTLGGGGALRSMALRSRVVEPEIPMELHGSGEPCYMVPVDADSLPELDGIKPQIWVDEEAEANDLRRASCRQHGIEYCVLPASQMSGFPEPPPRPSPPGRKKVVATGCYDWFHTGHVRFTEEVSAYGDLYVIIGHDANIRLLKGEGHPLLSEAERRYVVGSIKYVKQALISSGEGWLDADPEIQRLKPDIYAVNEDGDKGGKREYCEQIGIEYLVLKRTPAPGLPRRSSTDLRGF
jgi:cytidyltransferase-like protein